MPHGRAFVSYWETTTSGGTDEDNSWIGDCVSELEREAPSGALYVILLALDALKTSEVLAVLAAGPMENLLCNCGPEIVGSVEEIARRSPKFRLLLSGVWGRSRMDKEVWRRVCDAVARGPQFCGDFRTAGHAGGAGQAAVREIECLLATRALDDLGGDEAARRLAGLVPPPAAIARGRKRTSKPKN